MSMFGPKKMYWTVRSKSDSRWNKSGEGMGLVVDGGPQEMKDWIEKCREIYGDPPSDATFSCMKE